MSQVAVSSLQAEANRLGFSLFGIASATEADTFPHFERWLDQGYAAELTYLETHRTARQHPKNVFAPVRSVIMLGIEYAHPNTASSGAARVARYAQGPDYHPWIWSKLADLGGHLQTLMPEAEYRGVTDSAPLLERDFARRAGLGWFGKNTMLIHKRRGSFFLLAALLVSVDLPVSMSHHSSHCGTCTACLDACPTQAFPQPGILDARKCISYWTIEHRGSIPLEMRENIGGWIFGCDICQEVCPWNRHEALGQFPHQPELAELDAISILNISEKDFRQQFRHTAIHRTKRSGLRRNAAIVLGNVGDATALPALKLASTDTDDVVAETAKWSIEQIEKRKRY